MKNNLSKLVAVLVAFFIGVSIHNSCGEPQESPSMQELWNTIRSLQSEVAQLQEEIAELRTIGGGTQSNNGEVLIDRLFFDRGGYVSSKAKKALGDNYTIDYTYDDRGRIKTYTQRGDGYTYLTTYNYSGNNVAIKTDSTLSNGQTSTSTVTYEYY